MISSGLARGAGLLGQHVALALERGRIDGADVEGLRIGRGDMHGELLAEGGELAGVPGRFQRDQHADLAQARRLALWT